MGKRVNEEEEEENSHNYELNANHSSIVSYEITMNHHQPGIIIFNHQPAATKLRGPKTVNSANYHLIVTSHWSKQANESIPFRVSCMLACPFILLLLSN